MLKQFFLLLSVILLSRFSSFSQTKYEYYFDNDINLVKKSKAVFNGIGVYDNGVLELKIYDKKSSKLLVLQDFTDSSLTVSNGLFVNYFPNEIKQLEGNYSFGKKDGVWKRWDNDGKIVDSSIFEKGKQILQSNFIYYPDGKLRAQYIDSISIGKKVAIAFDEAGKIITIGVPSNKVDPDIVFLKTEVPASFPGGDNEWQKYIDEKLKNANAYGSCTLRFIIHKDSSISDINIMSSSAAKIPKIVSEALLNGPKWIPAKVNGRNVTAYTTITISFERSEDRSFIHL